MKKIFTLIITLLMITDFSIAQQQGLKIDTAQYTATTAAVRVRAKSLTNIIGLNGSITFNKNSLQYVSTTTGSNVSTLTGQYNGNNTTGVFTYLVSEPNVNTVTIKTDTILFTINFNVINNPLSTYNDNTLAFSNSPLPLEVDTTDLGSGVPVQVLYPTLANHKNGLVRFARPPVLSYASNNITDSVTNRPVGCTYQWVLNSVPVAGPNSSTYNNSPAGNMCLQVTYPNAVVVSCVPIPPAPIRPMLIVSLAPKMFLLSI